MLRLLVMSLTLFGVATAATANDRVTYFPVQPGAGAHDVAPAPDGTVYYTGQAKGNLGRLDPATGKVELIALSERSSPHGVVIAPDRSVWVTDSGQNANLRYDPATGKITSFPLPSEFGTANLNTGVFDRQGVYWYTGQGGVHGRVDPKTGRNDTWKSPRRGSYGIAVTPSDEVWYVALSGDHIGRIDKTTGKVTIVEPLRRGMGPRRIWSDSKGRLWVSFWNTGEVGRYDPGAAVWTTWRLPDNSGSGCYSVYVDEQDKVWLTDFRTNAIVRFDPATETFESFPSDRRGAQVRQMLGRPGEAWGAESGNSRLVRITY
jgi:virginiamycin B lyase